MNNGRGFKAREKGKIIGDGENFEED